MKRKGFTMIELIMVIVILGILAAVAIPRYVDLAGQARTAAAKGAIGSIRAAVAIAYARNAVNGSATYPLVAQFTATDDTRMFDDGVVPENPLAPASRAINGADGTGGWTYVQATGVVTSNDASHTAM